VRKESDRLGIGYVLALIGSAGLVAALFRPWYSLHIPPELIQAAIGQAQQLGVDPQKFGQAAAVVAQQLQAHPPTADAWQAFHYVDVALACICAAVAALTLARCFIAGAAVPGLPSIVSGLGALAAALIVYRIAVHPGAGDARFAGHALLHLENGAWLALVAAGLMAVGGRLAVAPRAATPAAPPVPAEWQAGAAKTWAGS
jgi:hypothetical protein